MKQKINISFSKEEDSLLLTTILNSKGDISSKIKKALLKLPNRTYSELHKRYKQIKK